ALTMAHKLTFSAEDVKKYILATGDAVTSLASKTSTSRQLNLFKALTILDDGVGASGVVAGDPASKKFYSDPNASRANEGMRELSGFGKSLLNAIDKKDRRNQPERIGGGNQQNEF
ncbi:MAG: serine protease/subtilase, partial [Bdellovibrionaceae bacterium]|nr:serine protease/subtilase [Pseudobdellovibrionaceae bacterium]